MDGNKLLQVITLLICFGLGYWIYKTNQEMHELLEENKIVWQKIDSLAGGVITKPASSRASSIFDEIISDDEIISEAEKEYRKARKPHCRRISIICQKLQTSRKERLPILSPQSRCHPNTTSRIIIRTKPDANPMVPRFEWLPDEASGISSSITTYSIAPAANARR